MSKHVLLLTSTNLTSNPRCLKEVRLLFSKGFQVTVVAFNLHNWTTEIEHKLKLELEGVTIHYLETTKQDLLPWITASIIEKICRVLLFVFRGNIQLNALGLSKRTWLLLQWIKKNKLDIDLIIAHNPPAFYPAFFLASKTSKPFALDVEDFHPGEGISVLEKKCVSNLLKAILPKSVYISCASPLIKKFTTDLLKNESLNNFIVLNNSFSEKEFGKPSTENQLNNKLQLVWFSQFIDYGRGIEKILPWLDKFTNDYQLTLIGDMRECFFYNEIKNRKYINCISSLSQVDLHLQLCKYDIGLALEDGNVDLNRNLCLTNKIYAYLQAGLYVLASDTEAQKQFLYKHKEHGIICKLDKTNFEDVLLKIIKNKGFIRAGMQIRFEQAKAFSWENESEVLIKQWEGILG